MIDKNILTEEEIEELRQKVINNAIERFGWSKERCERTLGSNTREFLQKVNLIDKEEQN